MLYIAFIYFLPPFPITYGQNPFKLCRPVFQISVFYRSVNLSMSEVPYAPSHYLLSGKSPLLQFPHESPSEAVLDFCIIKPFIIHCKSLNGELFYNSICPFPKLHCPFRISFISYRNNRFQMVMARICSHII